MQILQSSWCYKCVHICFYSSRRRHTRCALVTGVQTCALPILTGESLIKDLVRLGIVIKNSLYRLTASAGGCPELFGGFFPPAFLLKCESGKEQEIVFRCIVKLSLAQIFRIRFRGCQKDRKSTRLTSSH